MEAEGEEIRSAPDAVDTDWDVESARTPAIHRDRVRVVAPWRRDRVGLVLVADELAGMISGLAAGGITVATVVSRWR